jgi:hypothetical protein
MENKKPKTYVYLIYDKLSRLFKIGQSNNPEKRIKALCISNTNLKLIYYTDTHTEKELHNKYNSLRVSGEWFALDKKILMELIGSNKKIPRTFFYKKSYDDICKKSLKTSSEMKTFQITTTYDIIGIVLNHPEYIKTKCGQIINIKKGVLVKHTFSGSSTGYYLNGKFVKDRDIKIDKSIVECPF